MTISDMVSKVFEKQLLPCKNCFVQPICQTKTPWNHRFRICSRYIKYRQNINTYKNILETLRTCITLFIIFLIFLYIIVTFFMGLIHQYLLIFEGV